MLSGYICACQPDTYYSDKNKLVDDLSILDQPQLTDSELSLDNINKYFSFLLKFNDSTFEPWNKNQWMDAIKNQEAHDFPQSLIRNNFIKGIPKELRPRIWFWIVNGKQYKKAHDPELFQKLKSTPSINDDQIDKDVNRTFIHDKHMQEEKTQTFFFEILRAYSNYDIEMDQREIFRKGLKKLNMKIQGLQQKIQDTIPELDERFTNMGFFYYIVCFCEDYITILSYYAPLQIQERIIDLFLLEGHKIIDEILIALMIHCKPQILGLEKNENLVQFLKKDLLTYSFRKFLSERKSKFPASDM